MAGSWSTTSAFIKAKIAEMEMEIDDTEMAAPPTAQEEENQPRGRPRLKRENATLAENNFVNNEWLEVTDSVTDSFSARRLAGGLPEGHWMGSSIARKPIRTRAQSQGQRPREQVQRGLVNDWWAERLRADSVPSPDAVPVEHMEHMGLTTLKDLLSLPTRSRRELPVVQKNPEIWTTPPPEENGKTIQVLPARRERIPPLHEDQKTDTGRDVALATLPLAGSSVERPASPKQAVVRADSRLKASERSFESFYLVEEEDLQASLPHGVMDPDPLEPTKLEVSGIWSSQLSKDLDLIDTEYSWDFAPLKPVPSRASKPQKARNLTENKPYPQADLIRQSSDLATALGNAMSEPVPSSGSLPGLSPGRLSLSPAQEYEENDEAIDELDQDIENTSPKIWEDSSLYSSDSSASSEFPVFDDNDDEYFDPTPSFTWYNDLPERPRSPTPESQPMEDIAQVPAVQHWMSERLNEHQQSLTPETADQPSAATEEDELVLAAFLPLSVLVSDPRYANHDTLPTPWAAQTLLIERALEPERRSSLYPPRDKIVIQKATGASPYPTNTLVGNFYRKLMEDHADVEMSDVN